MASHGPVDVERDTADQDKATKVLTDSSERVQWIIYQALFNSGLRIDRAPHEIARLAPRKAS